MDELLIDEKKYISSKQAAKITGYAKDYIGQLCREGRVTARLVGRSWYVLESAIQDHRYGDESTKQEVVKKVDEKPVESSWTRQAPRYEAASPVDLLPKMRETVTQREEDSTAESVIQPSESLQNSWRAWFDRVEDTPAPRESEVVAEPVTEQEPIPEAFEPEPISEPVGMRTEENISHDEEDVTIPIHAVYKAPPRELMPQYAPDEADYYDELNEDVRPVRMTRGGSRVVTRIIKTLLIITAAVTLSLAVISTGYFDKYISTSIQATGVTGILTYTK
jgi:hypothetical protein